MHMKPDIILASNSPTRQKLLVNSNISFRTITSNVDEALIKQHCKNNNIPIYEISEILADSKARKVSLNNKLSVVIGCDQTLIFNNTILSKQKNKKDILERLYTLNNNTHTLLKSAVIYSHSKLVWKKTTKVILKMHYNDKQYLKDYVNRNYNQIVNSSGCYMIEGEGVRLFEHIEGDYFSILGMPLVEILSFLNLNSESN